jgi:hypothetical protein
MRSLFAIATLFLGISTTNADWVDNFAGGTAEQGWMFGSLPEDSSFTSSFSAGSDGHLLLADSSFVTGNASGGALAVFGFVPQTFSEPGILVRGVLNPTTESLTGNVGVLAYLNPLTTSTYGLTIGYGGSGDLDLTKTIGGETTPLQSITIADFDATASYTVELKVVGDSLRGRVFDDNNVLLHSLFATDATPFTSGFAGVVVQRGVTDPTLRGTFGSVSATAVPEPASLAILSAMGMIPCIKRYRKRSA